MLRLVCSVLLFCYALLVVSGLTGCEYDTINNYACAEGVSDGGCAMGQYGDDDGGIFTDESKLADSNKFVQGAGPSNLVDVVTRGNIPQLVTVNLASPAGALSQPVGPPAGTYGETVAILSFGVGSAPFVAEVDMGTGTQFSMLINRLRVDAEFRTLQGAATPASPSSLVLAASVGQGVIAVPRTPTRTLNQTYPAPSPGMPPFPAAGYYVNFTIPAFAKSMTIYARSTTGTPQLQVTVFGLSNNGIFSAPIITSPSQEIPLPNEARTISLVNVGTVNIFDIRIVFALAL